jgi:hypothetical protein
MQPSDDERTTQSDYRTERRHRARPERWATDPTAWAFHPQGLFAIASSCARASDEVKTRGSGSHAAMSWPTEPATMTSPPSRRIALLFMDW